MLSMVGLGMAVLSFLVFAASFPGASGEMLLPALVPVFSAPLCTTLLLLQCLLVYWLESKRALVLLLVCAGLGMLAAWSGHAMDIWGAYAQNGLTRSRTVLCAGACASGIALGIGLFRGWIVKR